MAPRDVTAALNDRREAMRGGIAALKVQLGQDVPRIVSLRPCWCHQGDARPDRHLQRPAHRLRPSRPQRRGGARGAAGVLRRRRAAPPVTTRLRGRTTGRPGAADRFLRKVSWSDEAPSPPETSRTRGTRGRRRSRGPSSGTRTSTSGGSRWRRRSASSALTKALTEFARQDHEDFARRSADLYRRRVGVSFLLPAGTGRMEQFYDQVVSRLREQMARTGQINKNSSEADLVQASSALTPGRQRSR